MYKKLKKLKMFVAMKRVASGRGGAVDQVKQYLGPGCLNTMDPRGIPVKDD